SGLNSKLDKNKTKFKTIEINKVYKGASVEAQRTAGSNRNHGLQVLGKINSTRRMPPPVNLPSLKSEH
ncbi:hypothetical protein HELRODRAFT_147603, partial [Helobdella robusta]|uniref:BAT2 N-terminal domain-containing protein n=1 Tax=Helobdella robusta TaxID=6412 RepID=T1EK17_HELRO